MRLVVHGDTPMVRLWADALAPVVVRHPDARVSVLVELTVDDSLVMSVENATDTETHQPHERNPLVVSCVRLSYFPGTDLAQKWLAAAWSGYCQHEALELVTILGTGRRPLDPHANPYPDAPCNRGLRDGLPVVLTPRSLVAALAVCMDGIDAQLEAGIV